MNKSNAAPDAIQAMLNDPCTPFWAKDLIRVALDKDAVDAYHTLAVITSAFKARMDAALGVKS